MTVRHLLFFRFCTGCISRGHARDIRLLILRPCSSHGARLLYGVSFHTGLARCMDDIYDKTGLVLVLSLVSFSLAWRLRAYTELMQEKNYDSKMDVRIN